MNNLINRNALGKKKYDSAMIDVRLNCNNIFKYHESIDKQCLPNESQKPFNFSMPEWMIKTLIKATEIFSKYVMKAFLTITLHR